MEDKYYKKEDYEKLCEELQKAESAVSYLLNIPLDNPDAEIRANLMFAMDDVATYCQDYLNHYKHYLELENYLCPTLDKMVERGMKRWQKLLSEDE